MKGAMYWVRRIEADRAPWVDIVRAIQADALEAAAEECAQQTRRWMSDEFEQCAEAISKLKENL